MNFCTSLCYAANRLGATIAIRKGILVQPLNGQWD